MSLPVAIGTAPQIEELNEMLVIYDANPNPVLRPIFFVVKKGS